MSIGSAGAPGSGFMSQSLALLLSQLDSAQQISPDGTSDGMFPASSAQNGDSSQAPPVTGSGKASLSDEILNLLVMMQQQSGAGSSSSSASTSIATASTGIDPLQSLVSAMDTNGDGTVSQSEMEGYIENLGGTQSEADQLFSNLDQNDSGSLTTAQLQNDLQQAPASMHGHHHHHHGGMPLQDALLSSQNGDRAANDSGQADSQTGDASTSNPFQSFFDTVAQNAGTIGTMAAFAV